MSDAETPKPDHADLPDQESSRIENVPARVDGAAIAHVPAESFDPSWLEPPKADKGEFNGYLHSLRRRWLSGLGIGMLVASLVAVVLWFAIPVNYEAESLLRVGREASFAEDKVKSMTEIEQMKEGHARLIKASFVIEAAYRDPNISQLKMVQRDRLGRKRKNPIAWLSGALRVNYLGDSDVLRVALVGEDTEQITKLVDAVVKAYQDEVVFKEIQTRQAELATLKEAYARTEQEIKRESQAIDELKRTHDIAESEQARMEFAMMMEELRTLRASLQEEERKLHELEDNWRMAQLIITNRVVRPQPYQIEDILKATNYQYAVMVEQIAELELRVREEARRMRGAGGPMQLQNELDELKFEKQQLEKQLLAEATDRFQREFYQIDPNMERLNIQVMEATLRSVDARVQKLRNDLADKEAFLDRFKVASTDLQAREIKVEELSAQNQELAKKISALELELKSQVPVERLQPAMIPDTSSFWIKVAQVLGASMFAMMGVIAAVAYVDLLHKRVNGAEDLDRISDLVVIGGLPQITPTGLSGLLPMRANRQRAIELGLNRSVDGVRTTLLCHKLDRRMDVVLVTSPLAQEGKTTLASQLAASMARSGRRTLLVDADLRNPQQHLVLGISKDRGVCEVLRGEASLDQVTRATAVANMWVVTAGNRTETIDTLLSSEAAQKFFEHARAKFDVVIVDSGPVLANPDAMLIGQHVDTTLLSVRRDVSVVPKVDQANERLRMVDIHVLGAVLHGEDSNIRPSEMDDGAATAASGQLEYERQNA